MLTSVGFPALVASLLGEALHKYPSNAGGGSGGSGDGGTLVAWRE